MKIKILLAFFILSFSLSFAQLSQQRSCGMEAYMENKMQNPEFRTARQAFQERVEAEYQRLRLNPENSMTTIRIPVAVHFPAGNESDRVCLETLAQSQIDIINADFGGTNSDLSTWTNGVNALYPGINNGSMDIEFVIATQNHPANTDDDLVEGGKAVTIGYNFGNGGDSDPRWAGYLNFLIKDIGQGLLGYSALGGNPSIGDTVVMNTFCFGSGSGCGIFVPQSPYNLGRTVTHELGHHYNLDHTWGNGGCSSDDNITDTPNIDGPTYGCPTAGAVTMCTNKSLTMNFMDYVNDACMYMFTAGQMTRAQAYINTISNQYLSNVLSVESLKVDEIMTVYPNPVSDELHIKTISNIIRSDASLELYDISGRLMQTKQLANGLTTTSFDVSRFTQGMYILKIVSKEYTFTKKIIVE